MRRIRQYFRLSSLRMQQFAARASASNIGVHEVHPHAQFQARAVYAPGVVQSVQMGQPYANPEVQVAANTAMDHVRLSRKLPIYVACPSCSCLMMIGHEASTTVPRAYAPASSSDLFSQNLITSGNADSATTTTSCNSGHSIKVSCSLLTFIYMGFYAYALWLITEIVLRFECTTRVSFRIKHSHIY